MSDWFSVWTNPNDPTNVVMIRLSDEEARQAEMERWVEVIQRHFPDTFTQLQTIADEFGSMAEQLTTKAEDRRRSRDDLRNKRRELMKRRGK